jgi:hypothetical protein
LNRTEYSNAVRDLLAVEIDAAAFLPPDDSGFGFDNIADVLSVSPMLTERYLSAALKISRLAVGDPTIRPATDTFEVNKYLKQDDRVSDDLPFGSRGGAAIRYYFPVDGSYVVKIFFDRTYDGRVSPPEPHAGCGSTARKCRRSRSAARRPGAAATSASTARCDSRDGRSEDHRGQLQKGLTGGRDAPPFMRDELRVRRRRDTAAGHWQRGVARSVRCHRAG